MVDTVVSADPAWRTANVEAPQPTVGSTTLLALWFLPQIRPRFWGSPTVGRGAELLKWTCGLVSSVPCRSRRCAVFADYPWEKKKTLPRVRFLWPGSADSGFWPSLGRDRSRLVSETLSGGLGRFIAPRGSSMPSLARPNTLDVHA